MKKKSNFCALLHAYVDISCIIHVKMEQNEDVVLEVFGTDTDNL